MAGQAAGQTLEQVKGAISMVKENGGISEMDTSAIGGAGRKGGNPGPARHHNIAEEFTSRMGGDATTGTTGYDSGYGHTS